MEAQGYGKSPVQLTLREVHGHDRGGRYFSEGSLGNQAPEHRLSTVLGLYPAQIGVMGFKR